MGRKKDQKLIEICPQRELFLQYRTRNSLEPQRQSHGVFLILYTPRRSIYIYTLLRKITFIYTRLKQIYVF